jgi:hypothetical protein
MPTTSNVSLPVGPSDSADSPSRQYMDDFQPAELEVVATVADGSSAVTLPPAVASSKG